MKTKTFINLTFKSLIALIILGLTTSVSAFVTVGVGVDCTYDNLQDAYDDADVFVRVTNQVSYSDVFVISKTKWFTGGYNNCTDAQNGNIGTQKTKWRRFNDGTVININANNASISLVVLDRFEIFDGTNLSANETGGINVKGNVSLVLNNSKLHDNFGIEGGAIRVEGIDAKVTLNDTQVINNIANTAGGGVYCGDSAHFTMSGNSAIENNTSHTNGGGIFATSDCQVSVVSGDTQANPLIVHVGIARNTAAEQGGGVYLQAGADMELKGNDTHPASLIGNISNYNSNPSVIGGGGVYLTGNGTKFTATNARIEHNQAKNIGAAVAAVDQAIFKMGRFDSPCWDNEACSSLSYNTVTGATGDAAAGYFTNQAGGNISQTLIKNNKANYTATIVSDHVSYVYLEGNIFTGNSAHTQPSALRLISITGLNNFAGNLDFFYNTVALNNVFNHFFLDGTSAQQWVRINNSIIWDQGDIIDTIGPIDPNLTADCIYLHESASFSVAQSATDLFTFNPNLIDPAQGNFHLDSQSLAMDSCDEDSIQSAYKDFNGNTRGFDNPSVVNLRGNYDAGAYEQYNDLIFRNGFE